MLRYKLKLTSHLVAGLWQLQRMRGVWIFLALVNLLPAHVTFKAAGVNGMEKWAAASGAWMQGYFIAILMVVFTMILLSLGMLLLRRNAMAEAQFDILDEGLKISTAHHHSMQAWTAISRLQRSWGRDWIRLMNGLSIPLPLAGEIVDGDYAAFTSELGNRIANKVAAPPRMGLPGGVGKIKYRITHDGLFTTLLWNQARSKVSWAWLIGGIGFCLYQALSSPNLEGGSITLAITLVFIVGAYIFIYALITLMFMGLKMMGPNVRGIVGEHTMEILDEGIEEATIYNRDILKWSGMKGISNGFDRTYINLENGLQAMLPKQKEVLEGNWGEFMEEVARRVSPPHA